MNTNINNNNNRQKLGKRICKALKNLTLRSCRKPQNAVASISQSVPFACSLSQIAVEHIDSHNSSISSAEGHSFPQITQVQSFDSNDANTQHEGFQIFEDDKIDPQNYKIGDNAHITWLDRFLILSKEDLDFTSSDDDNPKPSNRESIFRKKNNSV